MKDNDIFGSSEPQFDYSSKYILVNEFDESSVQYFLKRLRQLEDAQDINVICVIIDSYGGDVYALNAMRDLIRAAKKPIMTFAIGKAMSCGALLLASGNPGLRFAAPSAAIMVHDISDVNFGKGEDIISDANNLAKLKADVFARFSKDCKKRENFWQKILAKHNNVDLYLTAEEAKLHGIVDYIGIPDIEDKTSANVISR